MELPDEVLLCNQDWDPSYLRDIFEEDFYEFSDLWASNMSDCELVEGVEKLEIYSPLVEDISMDDSYLCHAVEQIEKR